MQGVHPIDECGWTRTQGVKRDINKSCISNYQADLCARLAIAESNPATVSMLFLVDGLFCRSIHVQALSKTKTEEITDFKHGRRMFWGRISDIQ